MTKKRAKNKQKNKSGVPLLITVAIIIIILGLVGMYALGVINAPKFITDIFSEAESTTLPPAAGNIAPKGEAPEYYEALPREEYAKALANMSMPEKFYRRYSISLFSGENVRKTDYNAIYNGGDWWVQTSENDVIMSTVICKGGSVKIYDNADNTSVIDASGEIDRSEYFGYTSLSEITSMINALASGEQVDYAGGSISDFSLSFTQSRGTGENIFSFTFTRSDGIKEEYTFTFESATILSAIKYLPSGEKIYQMETKDSRNNIEGINVDELFVIN